MRRRKCEDKMNLGLIEYMRDGKLAKIEEILKLLSIYNIIYEVKWKLLYFNLWVMKLINFRVFF